MHHVKRTLVPLSFLFLAACSGPAKNDIPSLNPEQAYQLLNFDNKAHAWITTVKQQDPGCTYRFELPDQSAHPTEIDIPHAVSCGGSVSPRQFNASVSFAYDKAAQKWMVSRFSS